VTTLTTTFRGDLYIAVAAAIPVLWLTVGFATSSIATIMHGLFTIRVNYKLTSKVTISFQGTTITAKVFGTEFHLYGWNRFNPLIAAFIAVFAISGAVGEVLSLWVLMKEDAAPWMKWVVLISATAVVLVATLTVIVSLVTASAQAIRNTEEADGKDVRQNQLTPGDRLIQVTDLHNDGFITDDEYEARREGILDEL